MPIEPLTEYEALERHMRLIQWDELGLKLNEPSPRTVWHYTNIAGLDGILTGSAIWASDYRFMNDRSEISFGLDIVEMCVAHKESTKDLTPEFRKEILKEIALMKRSMSELHILTASFCRRGNVLSQWRAYARQDGIAIGFKRPHIECLADNQNFATGPIHYYFSQNDKTLPEGNRFSPWLSGRLVTLDGLLQDLDARADAFQLALQTGDESVPFASTQQRSSIIKLWAAETAAFIKHPAFEEEQEWRCVRVIEDNIRTDADSVLHRVSSSRIIPYVNMRISKPDSKDRGIYAIVLGPNADGAAISHSVEFLIKKHGLAGLAVAAPFNPLRV